MTKKEEKLVGHVLDVYNTQTKIFSREFQNIILSMNRMLVENKDTERAGKLLNDITEVVKDTPDGIIICVLTFVLGTVMSSPSGKNIINTLESKDKTDSYIR